MSPSPRLRSPISDLKSRRPATPRSPTLPYAAIADRHDLTLPDWGPYTKRYSGISHVPASNDGLRFDPGVFSGYYRGRVNPPNVLYASGFQPWEAAPDLSYYIYRHELEWKDRVYADISYTRLDDHARLVRSECVNATDLPQNLALHLMASLQFPNIRPGLVTLPVGTRWTCAIDYAEARFGQPTPSDTLVYEGQIRSETRGDGFIRSSALGGGFGSTAGDQATDTLTIDKALADAPSSCATA